MDVFIALFPSTVNEPFTFSTCILLSVKTDANGRGAGVAAVAAQCVRDPSSTSDVVLLTPNPKSPIPGRNFSVRCDRNSTSALTWIFHSSRHRKSGDAPRGFRQP